MRVTLDAHPSDAPCCMKLTASDGRDILLQTDWDYPSIASNLGFSLKSLQVSQRGYYGLTPCDHGGTDGTVDCPECGYPAAAFIREAGEFLRDHDGETFEDPGYFD